MGKIFEWFWRNIFAKCRPLLFPTENHAGALRGCAGNCASPIGDVRLAQPVNEEVR